MGGEAGWSFISCEVGFFSGGSFSESVEMGGHFHNGKFMESFFFLTKMKLGVDLKI